MKTFACLFVVTLGFTLAPLAFIGTKSVVEQLSQTQELRDPPTANYIELQEVVIRSSDSAEDDSR